MKEKGLEIKPMHIKYTYTEDEKKDIAADMASLISDKEATEDQKKEVASKFTYEINKLDAKIKVLAQEFRQGYTYKNHDCYEIFDYESNEVFTHRADTDERVDTRTMTVSEKQKDMFDPREEITDEPGAESE